VSAAPPSSLLEPLELPELEPLELPEPEPLEPPELEPLELPELEPLEPPELPEPLEPPTDPELPPLLEPELPCPPCAPEEELPLPPPDPDEPGCRSRPGVLPELELQPAAARTKNGRSHERRCILLIPRALATQRGCLSRLLGAIRGEGGFVHDPRFAPR
jgi:hypothetical protein